MKIITMSAPLFALLFAAGIAPAHAGFPGMPSLGAPAASSGASAAEVVKNTRNALFSFTVAKVGLAEALGGYNTLAADQKLLEGMKNGDAAVTKEQMQTYVSIGSSANVVIEAKAAENAKLDAGNKSKAARSMVDYVKALGSVRKTLASLQGLAKNPMALGSDTGSAMFAVKELPSLLSGGASTTATLFKYLGANGVDLSEAKATANSMEK